jgi:hypothetical protein
MIFIDLTPEFVNEVIALRRPVPPAAGLLCLLRSLLSCLPCLLLRLAAKTRQRHDGPRDRHRDGITLGHLQHRIATDGRQLQWPSALQVLQHRGAERPMASPSCRKVSGSMSTRAPWLEATSKVSRMIWLTTSRSSGKPQLLQRALRDDRQRVGADVGNDLGPQLVANAIGGAGFDAGSLHRRPHTRMRRSLIAPDGSPSTIRCGLTERITPGLSTSAVMKSTLPMSRSSATALDSAPSGSTALTVSPSSARSRWKYHRHAIVGRDHHRLFAHHGRDLRQQG